MDFGVDISASERSSIGLKVLALASNSMHLITELGVLSYGDYSLVKEYVLLPTRPGPQI